MKPAISPRDSAYSELVSGLGGLLEAARRATVRTVHTLSLSGKRDLLQKFSILINFRSQEKFKSAESLALVISDMRREIFKWW